MGCRVWGVGCGEVGKWGVGCGEVGKWGVGKWGSGVWGAFSVKRQLRAYRLILLTDNLPTDN
ncbi:hypothetical protein OA58_23295 [Microcystis aeruginosa NIES-88]|nr:hypothetical protein OA58_23295 [Microcystis aeruginosa NIES-88]